MAIAGPLRSDKYYRGSKHLQRRSSKKVNTHFSGMLRLPRNVYTHYSIRPCRKPYREDPVHARDHAVSGRFWYVLLLFV